MELLEFNQTMSELNDICTKLEMGRGNMEVLADFLSREDIDISTKKLISQKLYNHVPILVASYQRLQGCIALILSQAV